MQLRKFNIGAASNLDELFSSQTRDRLGFIDRQPRFIAMLVKTHQVTPEKIKIAYSGGKVVGYVRMDSEADVVSTTEVVGVDDSTRHNILNEVERRPDSRWALCYGLCDARIAQLYERRGYHLHKPGFGRVMATSLDSSLTNDEIARLYGRDEKLFVIYSSDCF